MPVRFRSLRFKIIAWSFIPAAIVLTAVALFTFRSYQQVTERLVVERNRELTRLSANRIFTEMGRFANLLETEARLATIYRGNAAEQDEALGEARNRLAIFDGGLVILDAHGVVLAAEPDRPDILGSDWSTKPYFTELIRTSEAVFSDVVADGPGGAPVIVVAVPITQERGQFVGTLMGMFRVDARTVSAFYGNLVKLRLAGTGNAYLVDENGRAIYHSDTDLIATDRSDSPVVELAIQGQTNAVRIHNGVDREIVASFAPVPGTSWTLITEEPWDILIGTALGYRRFLLALLGLGLLFPVIVVAVGVRRITTPIEELIEAAEEVAEGSFGRKINASTGDELEELAGQFNRMSVQLEDSYTRLEQRVADRTRELQTLNTVVQTASRSLELETLLAATLDKVMEMLGFESGIVYVKDSTSGSLERICDRGLSPDFRQVVGKGNITQQVGESGAATFINDLRADKPDQVAAISEGYRAVAAVPLSAKDKVQGVLTIASRQPRRFTDSDRDLLLSIGNQIGIAVENARLYEQAQQAATIEERQRIARELHDAVSQTLFSASMLAEVLPQLWEKDESEGRRRLQELRELTRGAQAEMRTLLLELRPAALAEMSTRELLRQLAESVVGRARVPINLQVEEYTECPLPVNVKIALYRIAQEALNNVARHSGASQASVSLHCEDERFILKVVDNGRGFELESVPAGHFGLSIMRERAAEIGADLAVKSAKGEGTQITVNWSGE